MADITNSSSSATCWGFTQGDDWGLEPFPQYELKPGDTRNIGGPDMIRLSFFHTGVSGTGEEPFFEGSIHIGDALAIDPDTGKGTLTRVGAAHVTKTKNVGESVAQGIVQGRRSASNTILTQLAADPIQVLVEHGLDSTHFDHAVPADLAAFEAFLKDRAKAELDAAHAGRSIGPRGALGCWACEVGLGALIIGIGASELTAVLAAGAVLYEAILAFIELMVSAATAMTIPTRITAAGLFVGEKAIEAGISWVCGAAGGG